MVYYNEIDPYCCQWLQNLMGEGLIPCGVVDCRPIQEVTKEDVEEFTQCHFFAGIGGWSQALELAGWPEDRPVWTGSCPCQPFSVAGKRAGTSDARHLWPEFYRLISECSPPVIFGEQVTSKDGREWLSGVRLDLEGLGYAVGAADLCAASAGAPHIRQRLWWVSDAEHPERWPEFQEHGNAYGRNGFGRSGEPGQRLCYAPSERLLPGSHNGVCGQQESPRTRDGKPKRSSTGSASRLQHAESNGRVERWTKPSRRSTISGCFWSDYEILQYIDGKARRTKPGLFPLANGVPARVGKLRAYGNAIVSQVAAEFIQTYLGLT